MFKTNGSHNCKHFLNLSDLTKEELKEILTLSAKLKKNRFGYLNELKNKSLAMIFEKNSTRTRISFEVGMQHLGGNSLFLSANDIQISRGEPLEHTAKVISSMVECVVMRCNSHADLEKMANHSSSPIINGLSDESHPCQLLADIFTIIERTGSIEGKTICWSGYPDNNLLSSYIEASFLFDFKLNIATPFPNLINQKFLKKFDKNVSIFTTLSNAAKSCDALVTDVWQSMGQNLTKDEVEKMKDFQINKEIVECAKKDALIMHCLPMHIGEEISKEASEMKNEAIWQEAENRLHTQKALLITLLKD